MDTVHLLNSSQPTETSFLGNQSVWQLTLPDRRLTVLVLKPHTLIGGCQDINVTFSNYLCFLLDQPDSIFCLHLS